MDKYIVINISELRPSVKTNGYYKTLIFRNMNDGKTYKTYIDTSFYNYNNWSGLKERQVISGLNIINSDRKLIDFKSIPKYLYTLDDKEEI